MKIRNKNNYVFIFLCPSQQKKVSPGQQGGNTKISIPFSLLVKLLNEGTRDGEGLKKPKKLKRSANLLSKTMPFSKKMFGTTQKAYSTPVKPSCDISPQKTTCSSRSQHSPSKYFFHNPIFFPISAPAITINMNRNNVFQHRLLFCI